MQHTHPTLHSHTQHISQTGHSNREGLRAWPLHSRDTAPLVLRHEGLARHHQVHDPHEGMSIQCNAIGIEQRWTPRKGARGNKGDNRGGTPYNTRRRGNKSAVREQETDPASAQDAQHQSQQHIQETTHGPNSRARQKYVEKAA